MVSSAATLEAPWKRPRDVHSEPPRLAEEYAADQFGRCRQVLKNQIPHRSFIGPLVLSWVGIAPTHCLVAGNFRAPVQKKKKPRHAKHCNASDSLAIRSETPYI